jgi:hypothetical protein
MAERGAFEKNINETKWKLARLVLFLSTAGIQRVIAT